MGFGGGEAHNVRCFMLNFKGVHRLESRDEHMILLELYLYFRLFWSRSGPAMGSWGVGGNPNGSTDGLAFGT